MKIIKRILFILVNILFVPLLIISVINWILTGNFNIGFDSHIINKLADKLDNFFYDIY